MKEGLGIVFGEGQICGLVLLLEDLYCILFGYPRVVVDGRERCWCLISPS